MPHAAHASGGFFMTGDGERLRKFVRTARRNRTMVGSVIDFIRGAALKRLDLSGNPEVSVSSPIVICSSNRRSLENLLKRPVTGVGSCCRWSSALRCWPPSAALLLVVFARPARPLPHRRHRRHGMWFFSELYPRVMGMALGAALG